jgi:hypothetical protein
LADRSPLTCALAPAREPRGSLQREYDEKIDRQTVLMAIAERYQGFPIEIHEVNGLRFWYVPRDLVPTVGCQVAIVR